MAQSNEGDLAKTHVLVDLPGWGKIWAIKDILAYYEHLEQDRKQHELEARIAVWESIKSCVENTSDNTERLMRFNLPQFDDIIAELKAERERLGK